MSKKIKIIISAILCIVIIGSGIFLINRNHSTGENKSKQFIESIKLIKDKNYIDAYNNIKNSNVEEKELIQTIILHKFTDQITISSDVIKKIGEEADNITDYMTYTHLYSRNPIYQQNIDKFYDTDFAKLYEIKNTIPMEIMFEDSKAFYDLYFEYLDVNNGVFRNYESNITNNKNELISKIENIKVVTEKMFDEYKTVIGKYPVNPIPDEYKVLLDI